MIISANKLIRWSLTEIFLQEHHKVDSAASIKDALDKAGCEACHIILADLDTHVKSGIEMLKKICSKQPEAKIIVLSALTRSELEPLLDNLTVFSIIEKAFKSEQVRSSVREALGTTP